ncbi:MAG: helix-turn-helix transcriptional regulator [Candidatus Competibacter sp.]
MNINQQVGRRIKVRRVELGMTQAELAQKLSVGQSNLSYIERGQRDVSVSLLAEIAEALKCRPEEFFRWPEAA